MEVLEDLTAKILITATVFELPKDCIQNSVLLFRVQCRVDEMCPSKWEPLVFLESPFQLSAKVCTHHTESLKECSFSSVWPKLVTENTNGPFTSSMENCCELPLGFRKRIHLVFEADIEEPTTGDLIVQPRDLCLESLDWPSYKSQKHHQFLSIAALQNLVGSPALLLDPHAGLLDTVAA